MITKTQFCADPLAAAVVRQMGGWQNFKDAAEDISNHGIDSGFHGFIYYTDTVKFAKRNAPLIRALATEQADSLGMGTIEMVRGFNCLTDKRTNPPTPEYSEDEVSVALYGRESSDSADMILNALAWYAGEEVARRYCDALESEAA